MTKSILKMNIFEAQILLSDLIIEHKIEYPYKISIRDIKLNDNKDFCYYRLNVTLVNDNITEIHGWF